MADSELLPTSLTQSEIIRPGRLFYATYHLLQEMLQELLRDKQSPDCLSSDVRRNEYLYKNLRPEEWKLIRSASTDGYLKFDIQLIYKILRNLSLISAPSCGWEYPRDPSEKEVTIGDDVERIRRIRNKLFHRGNVKLQDEDISQYFSTLKNIAERFERCLGKQKGFFVSKFEELEKCDCDENIEEMNNRLHKLEEKNVEMHLNVKSVKSDCEYLYKTVSSVNHELSKLDVNLSCVQNQSNSFLINDMLQMEIEEWVEVDTKFIRTRAVDAIIEALKTKDCVTVTGASGIGKSAIIHHIALSLNRTDGFKIIPCRSASDIENHFRKDLFQVFVLDDVCGRYILIQNDAEMWIKHEENIKRILGNRKSKILISCRSQVFKENQFQRLSLFVKHCFDISSVKYSLTITEKLDIAEQYLDTETRLDLEKVRLDLDDIDFFPLKCSLYTKDTNYTAVEFFRNPFDIYTTELDKLWDQHDKTKFCALFLCVICNDFVNEILKSEGESKESRKKIKSIFELCQIDRGTPKMRIIEQFESLLSTYLKKIDDTYLILHDRLFDFLCSYFGRNLQKGVIRYADNKIIREHTMFKSIKAPHSEFTIMIDGENENEYFRRITHEIAAGQLDELFINNQMKFDTYRAKFIDYIYQIDIIDVNQLLHPNISHPESALNVACFKGYLDLVKLFVTYTDDINSNDLPLPLHEASYGGHQQIVLFLIKKGANVNKEDCDGWTPLIGACRGGHTHIAKILVENGADVNKGDKNKTPPLVWAQKCNHKSIEDLLIVNGAF